MTIKTSASGREKTDTLQGKQVLMKKSIQYKPMKKHKSDCIYYLGSARQAIDNAVITYLIKQTFEFVNNNGNALESL
jgi:hypothetical protein